MLSLAKLLKARAAVQIKYIAICLGPVVHMWCVDKKTRKRSGGYRRNLLQNFANRLLSSMKECLAVAPRPQEILRHLNQFNNG